MITQERKIEICDMRTGITLDGVPADVIGWKHPFPLVVTKDGRYRVEFCWETVDRIIVNKGGNFKS